MASTATTSQSRPRKVSSNAIAQVSGRLFYLVSRVALPPFILHYVSPAEYGIWATCFLIISYIGIGAFGVSNVYIRYVAEYSASRRTHEIGRLLATGLCISMGFSILVFGGLLGSMPWILEGFKMPMELRDTASILILGTVGTMLLDMTFGAFAYVLIGLHRIVEQTVVWIISVLIETALIVLFLVEGYGMIGMLWAFAIRYLFATVIYAVLVYRAVPGLRLRLRGEGQSPIGLFVKYGGVMQLTGLLGIVLYSFERVVAGFINGVSAVGVLDIGQKFPVMSSQVFSSASNSILVGLTHHHTKGLHDEVRRLYRQSSRYVNLLNGCAMGFMAPFAGLIVTAWIGDKPAYQNAADIMVVAAVGYHFHALTGPASSYFQGVSRPGLVALLFQLPHMIMLAGGMALIQMYGEGQLMEVIVIAGLARVMSSLGFIIQANRWVRLSQMSYLRTVAIPGLLPYALGYGLEAAWRIGVHPVVPGDRMTLILILSGLLLAYALLVVLVLAAFLEPEERDKARRLISALPLPRYRGRN